MDTNIKIRKLVIEDFESITDLSNELGYILDQKDVYFQLNMILNDSNHSVFGAFQNKKLVGYIHSTYTIGLTSLPFTEIKALIVCEKERGKGIGKLLVRKVENICNSRRLRVRCNIKRKLAHKFYSNLNFNFSKEQKVFEKFI